MPLYEVHHSYPLEHSEQQTLAESITKLHAKTFTTPSFFVHVRFIPADATDNRYYVAGKVRTTSINRILAHVRTSSSRSKADFDKLAEQIEEAWITAIYGEKQTEGKDAGKRPKEVDEIERDAVARKLLAVVFVPMVTVRENGLAIPEAGKEAQWFKDNMSFFEKQVEEKGDEDYRSMLEELNSREDLKKMMGGGVTEQLGGVLEKLGITGGEKKEDAATNGEKQQAAGNEKN